MIRMCECGLATDHPGLLEDSFPGDPADTASAAMHARIRAASPTSTTNASRSKPSSKPWTRPPRPGA